MRSRLESVQALRAAACLLVVLSHLGQFEALFGLGFSPLAVFVWVGHPAIDVFFAVSGFVITYGHRDKFGNPAVAPGFLLRRLWRVFPVYWLALAAAALVQLMLTGNAPPSPGTWADWACAATLCPTPGGRLQPWVPQAWTLTYELAFYLAFAVLLGVPKRWAAAGFAGWFAAACAAGLAGWRGDGRFAPLWFSPQAAEFLLGAGIGLTVKPGGRPRLAAAVALAWLGAGVATAFRPNPLLPVGAWEVRALVFGPPAALLVYAAAAADLGGSRRPPRWLVALGEASYPVYLFHIAALHAVTFAWDELGFSHRRVPHVGWVMGTLGGSLAVGYAVHRWVEVPLMNLARRKRPAAAAEVVGPFALPRPTRAVPAAAPARRAA